MTTADFKDKLETLDETDLEAHSSMVATFGEPLLETYCNKYADYTIGHQDDLDDQCYRAVYLIMQGKPLSQAQALISDAHPGGSGAREILVDLYAKWHASID